MEQVLILVHLYIMKRFFVHPFNQRPIIGFVLQLDADKSRSIAFIIFLRIFKPCNVIIRPEDFVKKFAERPRSLRKIDDKIMLKTFKNQGTLLHFLHSSDIVIAPAYHTHHVFPFNLILVQIKRCDRKSSSRFSNNRTFVI